MRKESVRNRWYCGDTWQDSCGVRGSCQLGLKPDKCSNKAQQHNHEVQSLRRAVRFRALLCAVVLSGKHRLHSFPTSHAGVLLWVKPSRAASLALLVSGQHGHRKVLCMSLCECMV